MTFENTWHYAVLFANYILKHNYFSKSFLLVRSDLLLASVNSTFQLNLTLVLFINHFLIDVFIHNFVWAYFLFYSSVYSQKLISDKRQHFSSGALIKRIRSRKTQIPQNDSIAENSVTNYQILFFMKNESSRLVNGEKMFQQKPKLSRRAYFW